MAMEEESSFLLPPGFRFHPTDEELITHYLSPKILNHAFVAKAMDVVDLNKCEPWDLPGRAKMGGKEWYFFCQRDRKYPTGTRTNRATTSGYWKATGKDKEIFKGRGLLIGMRKTLVFYLGRAPKGEKSNWVMHEFRVHGKPPTLSNILKAEKNEWVICRVFHKKGNNVKRSSTPTNASSLQRINSFSDELPDSFMLPPLTDPPCFNPGTIDTDSFDVKQLLANSVPMPNTYLYSMIGGDENNDTWSPTLPMSTEVIRFLEPLQPMNKHCKAEQFSNQSILSQDTGLTADRYTVISSVIAKHDIDSEDFNLYNMWRN